jgi:NAD(P)-dependent dehydrogenase (short-subunit alcohol dehydrogenase family)
MKLKGKVAIITGGGSGLGREVALAYAQEGASLVLTSNAARQIEQVAEECHVFGVPALPVYADVSAPDDVAAMVERSLKEFNRIDILVCSAAVNEAVLRDEPRTRLLDLDPEHWKRIIDVNVNLYAFIATVRGKAVWFDEGEDPNDAKFANSKPFDLLMERDHLLVGSPESVTNRLLRIGKTHGIQHWLLGGMDGGSTSEAHRLRSIELMAKEVMPALGRSLPPAA